MLFKKKQNQQNQLQSQQNPLNEQLRKLSSLSPNLVPSDEYEKNSIHSRSTTIIRVAKIIIFFTQAAFILLLLVNLSTSIANKRLERDIEELETELATKKDIETNAIQLIQRINLYKNLQQDKQPVSKNVDTVITNVPNTIKIQKILYRNEKITLIASSPDVLDFALLITKYLELENVKEVALISATLTNSTLDRHFTVQLEISFN